MILVTLRGIAARKLRSLLTALGVVLGVALVSGSLILTDTIEKAFASVLTTSYRNVDAVITASHATTGATPPTVPESLLEQVRRQPEVAQAAGTLVDFSGTRSPATLLDRRGTPIDGVGPTFTFGVDPRDVRFSPLELVTGRWAAGRGEVVVDVETVDRHRFSVGDSIDVLATGPVQRFTIVGVARFRDAPTSGGAVTAVFDVATAQQLHGSRGYYAIAVAARDGVSREQLIGALRPMLPFGVEVRTGQQQAAADVEAASFVGSVRYLLVAFGVVALLVGALVIANTLSITVALRTPELATLRMLGATRRQVRRAIALEGLVLGVAASLIGVAAGFLFAEGLRFVFGTLGADLPDAPTVFRGRTALVSVVLGVGVTSVATLIPAVRATRVAPLAAVHDTPAATDAHQSRRLVRAAVYPVAARAVRFVTLSLARPLAAVGGAAARLARDNAVRNPTRTASTAAALTIGVTSVTFASVVANAVLTSGETAVRRQVRADYMIGAPRGWATAREDVGRAAAAIPGITAAGSIRTIPGGAALDTGRMVGVSGVDTATIARLYRFTWREGSDSAVPYIGAHGALIDDVLAEQESLAVGDRVVLHTRHGNGLELTVRAIFERPSFDSLLGEVVVAQDVFSSAFPPQAGALTLIRGGDGRAVERLLRNFPHAELLTPAQLAEARHTELRSILRLLYVLLALAVLVSVIGLVNTLVLSTIERRREIGMLRAIGMSRRDVRRMVRYESVLTALLGSALAIPLGIGAGAAVIGSTGPDRFALSIPFGTLLVLVGVTVAIGVAAAALPARRAARLNVVHALQYQ